jgi:hypothetical protein
MEEGKTTVGCNCLNEVEKQFIERVKKSIQEKYKVDHFIEDSSAGFTNKGLFFEPVRMGLIFPFELKYVRQKKNGEPENKVKTYTTSVIPTYCPFCGKELLKKEE